MLSIEDLYAGYDGEVLHGVSLEVREGEFVCVIGANTAGKSTLLRSISRLVPRSRGRIVFGGADLMRLQPYEVPKLGIAHVPEGRHLFPDMTVEENLMLGAYPVRRDPGHARRLEECFALFPRLKERRNQRAGTLSGGEQQMVALGRAMMLGMRMLILDEPSHGLAPIVVDQVHDALVKIHESGTSILLVEQNTALALSVASRGYVLESGRVVLSDTSRALQQNPKVREAYLGL
ncbi:ABC transporter ATP-binding protein [Chelativorans sp. M5D2P16]|uniref:ABC transporter ATP-binding protein n=1 Tax=Chelativorans sp. M5D2P16 TaxID=3095678 RepID=UPI002ACA1A22|nr:ABC transporter ATP-binding protein [Chelativorans sp. M5D2P16]MDZ5696596.1 ABC transporter ATP-binding protein [Chelativorans sp. M5D2P16]